MSKLKWSDLFSFGNVAWISIFGTGLKKQKRPEDFGMSDEDGTTRKAGTEGHWNLVDPSEISKIQRIENKIRNLLSSYAVPFPLVPSGQFIPDSSFDSFMSDLEAHKKDFYRAVETLAKNFDNLFEAQVPLIEKQIRKIAGEDYDCTYAINRLKMSAPTSDQILSKFRVQEFVSSFKAPINEQVASKLEQEGNQVNSTIDTLIEESMKPLKEKIADLLRLVETGNRRSFSKKVIKAGLRQCEVFERKNVFNDKIIANAISNLKRLLEQIETDIDNEDTEEFRLGLVDLQQSLEKQTIKKVSNRVKKSIGSRKIL